MTLWCHAPPSAEREILHPDNTPTLTTPTAHPTSLTSTTASLTSTSLTSTAASLTSTSMTSMPPPLPPPP
ncbi:unnamed protein product [Arctogadus glacialis]